VFVAQGAGLGAGPAYTVEEGDFRGTVKNMARARFESLMKEEQSS
jgi:hypothetical protein